MRGLPSFGFSSLGFSPSPGIRFGAFVCSRNEKVPVRAVANGSQGRVGGLSTKKFFPLLKGVGQIIFMVSGKPSKGCGIERGARGGVADELRKGASVEALAASVVVGAEEGQAVSVGVGEQVAWAGVVAQGVSVVEARQSPASFDRKPS